jgi:hypothetical protein
MLVTRELQNLARDTAAFSARFGLTIFMGILIGIIFLHVGSADPNDPEVRIDRLQVPNFIHQKRLFHHRRWLSERVPFVQWHYVGFRRY